MWVERPVRRYGDLGCCGLVVRGGRVSRRRQLGGFENRIVWLSWCVNKWGRGNEGQDDAGWRNSWKVVASLRLVVLEGRAAYLEA